MPSLVEQFVTHFARAIEQEMAAIEEHLGTAEVEVRYGVFHRGPDADGNRAYGFDLVKPNERLIPGMTCTLRHGDRTYPATLAEVGKESVVVATKALLDTPDDSSTLILYPSFLYERLLAKLRALPDHQSLNTGLALSLFGKAAVTRSSEKLTLAHPELNESQRRAVELCVSSSVAFVWGPPGTGKTMTLAHIVAELHARGKRLLIASNTNAAVDQALYRMAHQGGLSASLDKGEVVRVGQTDAPTFGAHLSEIRNRMGTEHERAERDVGHARCYHEVIESIDEVLGRLRHDQTVHQLDMFGLAAQGSSAIEGLDRVFPQSRATRLGGAERTDLIGTLKLRRKRLERAASAAEHRVSADKDAPASAAEIISGARVLLSTLANVWASGLLDSERYDVVIIEEAGMAILPAAFYCAALAREKVIVVGDPRQLPPIVQSNDTYVHRALGRSVFDVAVPDPSKSDLVAMLDTQYRMHPSVAALVSRMFYGGRLRNGPLDDDCMLLQYKRPFQGRPLVIIDTGGKTICEVAPKGHSRVNRMTAALAVEIAREAHSDGVRSVAVITPYTEQARLIRSIARQANLDTWFECSTVHRFQGHEKDMIVVDTVDTEPLPPSVLLHEKGPASSARNLLNVSISRARGKLVIIADISYFKRHAPGGIIDELLDTASRLGSRTGLWEMTTPSGAEDPAG